MKTWLEYVFFRAMKSVFFVLPRPLCLAAGRAFGGLVFYLDGRHRRIALANLETAFMSDRPYADRRAIALRSFRHFGAVMADVLKLMSSHRLPENSITAVEGEEYVAAALGRGKGAIIFTAHFGNWELGISYFSRLGRLNVVARALDNKLLETELAGLRRALGARVIDKKLAAKPVLQALRRGEMVAILIDQNVLRSEAVFVPFFGKAAATTPAVGAFCLRTGTPVLPAFAYPVSKTAYRLKFLEPLEFEPGGDVRRDVLKITEICTNIIENEIRRNPGYWLWFHDRWRTRPVEEQKKP